MPATVDPVRFPQLSAYLATLPDGLASYPECVLRASNMLPFMSAKGASPLAGVESELPEPVQRLLAAPPPNSAWIPEVHLYAFLLANVDRAGMSDDAYEAWVLATCQRLYSGLLYKLVMSFVSRENVVEVAGSRWATQHRGTTLSMRSVDRDHVRCRLDFPPRLMSTLIVKGYRSVLLAVWQLVEARGLSMRLVESSETMAEYETTWASKR